MALSVSRLKDRTRSLRVAYADDVLTCTYYPDRMTPELEDRLGQTSEEAASSTPYLHILCSLLATWDLLDMPAEEGGTVLPISEESLRMVPSPLLVEIGKAMGRDNQPDPQTSGGSFGA